MLDYSQIQKKLDAGNAIANQILGKKYEEMKKIIGLG